MKALLVLSAFCLLSVFGHPSPDQEVKLEERSSGTIELVPETEKGKVMKSQGSEQDRTKLLEHLLTKYNKLVNPDDIKLSLGVNLVDFRVKENQNAIESYIWMRYAWSDKRLQWKPEDFGGVEVIRLDSTAIWKPDVTLYNSADPVNMINCWDSNILLYSSGNVLFVPPCKMTSTCQFNLKRHPYGEQECSMKFGSWTFDGNVLDLQFYGGQKELDLKDMHNSSGFEVVSTTAERHVRYYSCCAEPYPDLTFNMTIKRVPGDELFHKL